MCIYLPKNPSQYHYEMSDQEWEEAESRCIPFDTHPELRTIPEEQKRAIGEAASRTHKGKKKNYKCITPVLKGSDNPRSKSVIVEGVRYDTITECKLAYGMKNHNAVRYRLNSPKWTEWNYE